MQTYSKLLADIATLHANHSIQPTVPAPPNFQFPEAYPGQAAAYAKIAELGSCALTSHTGTGKTAVFLAATHGAACIVIEPRKFLQKQVANYNGDALLFGRSEYPCRHAASAASAPCTRKIRESDGIFFMLEGEKMRYPCGGCKYFAAVSAATRALKSKRRVICNFGNFWALLDNSDIVVVDEADLFFREIAKPTRMYYSDPKHDAGKTIEELLKIEAEGIARALKSADIKTAYYLQNLQYTVSFLRAHQELCFKYQRKDRYYIEVSPDNVGILKDKLFAKKRLIAVSATIGNLNLPEVTYSVPQRAGIFYCPVGNMSSRNLQQQPGLMKAAADRIQSLTLLTKQFGVNKVVVHCGNIGNHATKLYNLLRHDICTLHQRGNIMKTIADFETSNHTYLLVASAEYGADFGWCGLQFILKFPFASLDERMRTLEKTMGKAAFNAWYIGDTRARLIQQCGRNTRGFNDFGVTVILDYKFWQDYTENNRAYPVWFRERVRNEIY